MGLGRPFPRNGVLNAAASVRGHFASWGVAAVVCVPLGVWLAVRAGFPLSRSLLALLGASVLLLVGSKGLYLLEAVLCPFDDYAPAGYRQALHGFRIPGGVLLLAVSGPVMVSSLRMRWREFGDTTILAVPAMLMILRLGCFLNGCCFGRVSDVPWAIQFPRGSWVFWYHATAGWVTPEDQWSLPVHPLQLYFVAAAALLLGVLILFRHSRWQPGRVQIIFYLAFFGVPGEAWPF